MTRTSSPSRLLVLVLTLHLAHVPVPVWDGDDIGTRGATSLACESIGLPHADYSWDVDLLLLGVDPPEDSDEGPIDSQPEHRDAELFGLSRPSQDAAVICTAGIGACVDGAPVSTPWRVSAPRPEPGPGPSSPSYGASFGSVKDWRTLLCRLIV